MSSHSPIPIEVLSAAQVLPRTIEQVATQTPDVHLHQKEKPTEQEVEFVRAGWLHYVLQALVEVRPHSYGPRGQPTSYADQVGWPETQVEEIRTALSQNQPGQMKTCFEQISNTLDPQPKARLGAELAQYCAGTYHDDWMDKAVMRLRVWATLPRDEHEAMGNKRPHIEAGLGEYVAFRVVAEDELATPGASYTPLLGQIVPADYWVPLRGHHILPLLAERRAAQDKLLKRVLDDQQRSEEQGEE